MEQPKRNKNLLIAALVCFGLSLVLLIPTFIFLSGVILTFSILLAVAGLILLTVYLRIKNPKLVFGILFLVFGIIFTVCAFQLTREFSHAAFPCSVAGLILLYLSIMEKIESNLTLPILAFILSVSCIPLWLIGEAIRHSASTPFFLSAIFFPLAGMIMGICALGVDKEKRTKVRIGLSIAAIVFPILVVIVLILLFSTGALVISLM